MRITPVRPEEKNPIKKGFNISNLILPALRENPQQASILLEIEKNA